MSEAPRISRRGLVGAGLGAVAGAIGGRLAGAAPAGPGCGPATPEQVRGPFYPESRPPEEDPDLTRVEGRPDRASGEVIYVEGRVVGKDCGPLEDAVVEVWQANRWGRYDHERDRGNPRPLDPNFQGWARMLTDVEGGFRFKTIKPGSYRVEGDWVRPPHIHFRVSRRGYHELVTQMYFAGEPLNQPDRIRGALTEDERERVTVTLQPAPDDAEARVGRFEIVLRPVT